MLFAYNKLSKIHSKIDKTLDPTKFYILYSRQCYLLLAAQDLTQFRIKKTQHAASNLPWTELLNSSTPGLSSPAFQHRKKSHGSSFGSTFSLTREWANQKTITWSKLIQRAHQVLGWLLTYLMSDATSFGPAKWLQLLRNENIISISSNKQILSCPLNTPLLKAVCRMKI